MKICHIELKNFSTFKHIKIDMSKYNVIVGKNNTGKSNLLRGINCFYNPKLLKVDDITKDSNGNRISNELEIILTFDNLNNDEINNNNKYYFNNKMKIRLKFWINKENKPNFE